LREYNTGADALNAVVKGEADIAVGPAEFPLVVRAFRKEQIRVIGSIDKIEFIYVVARRDRGIKQISDLKGKRVGTTIGTVAEFHLGRFLKALVEAEGYVIRNPTEAKAIVQTRQNLDAAYMETIWSQNQYGLTLDQSLIVAMEDEARWMIKNNLTDERQVPNFLDYIYEDALKAVKPEAVNIIH